MARPPRDSSDGIFKKSQMSFLVSFFLIFLGTLAVLSAFGLLPSELKEQSNGNNFIEAGQRALDASLGQQGGQSNQVGQANNSTNNSGANNSVTVTPPSTKPVKQNQNYGLLPGRLIIPSINVDTAVDNPTSTSTENLDYELTKGPVHYPGSGTVGSGNMFIFGHSTGWKVVINKAYKVFNDIKTLKQGDVIYITANTDAGQKTYEYRVREVNEVNKNDTLISFDTTSNMLTLSTCDSFGAKTDRYVVTADFVGLQATQ